MTLHLNLFIYYILKYNNFFQLYITYIYNLNLVFIILIILINHFGDNINIYKSLKEDIK